MAFCELFTSRESILEKSRETIYGKAQLSEYRKLVEAKQKEDPNNTNPQVKTSMPSAPSGAKAGSLRGLDEKLLKMILAKEP